MAPTDKDLDDYDHERDPSVFDDIRREIDADEENDVISPENADELRGYLQQEEDEDEKESRDNDFPTENMDPDEDTPFGTGD